MKGSIKLQKKLPSKIIQCTQHYMTTLIMKHECRTMSVKRNKALNLTTGIAVLTNDCMCVCMYWVILQESSYIDMVLSLASV